MKVYFGIRNANSNEFEKFDTLPKAREVTDFVQWTGRDLRDLDVFLAGYVLMGTHYNGHIVEVQTPIFESKENSHDGRSHFS